MLNRFYLKKPTNHFEDVQTSPWCLIYHAGRHDGCGFTAARLLGGKKKRKKIPFFLLPESVADEHAWRIRQVSV